MGYFHDKVLKLYPVLGEQVKLVGRGMGAPVPVRVLALKNTETEALGNPETVSPALREIVRYGTEIGKADLKRYSPEAKNNWRTLSGIRNVFLVTDSSREAKIAALYMGGLLKIAENRCREYEVEDLWQGYAAEIPDEDLHELKIVSASLACRESKGDENDTGNNVVGGSMRRMLEMQACLEVLDTDYLYVEGLDDPQGIGQKTEILKAFADKIRLIRVAPSVFDSPAVQELVMLDPDHTMVFRMEKTGIDHYLEVCRNLLKDENSAFTSDEELRSSVARMMKAAGRAFSEEWIGSYLDQGADGERIDVDKMFRLSRADDGKTASEQLDQMPGLHNVKSLLREMSALAVEESRNPLLKLHRNMIFTGNPGVGKSVAADLVAKALAEQGITAPVMVSPSRDQLIGRFVGHTAPLVAKAFDSARGGVLFVDEAGFFLADNGKGFCMEAIKEFVRYMELYPDVTVIFAMYASEVEEFLKMDDGLRSRISRIVNFEDYNASELCDITAYMLSENGYELLGGRNLLENYFKEARSGDHFGNARFARKLTEAIILSKCMKDDSVEERRNEIREDMVAQGIARLKKETAEHRTGMGFLGTIRKFERGEECERDQRVYM